MTLVAGLANRLNAALPGYDVLVSLVAESAILVVGRDAESCFGVFVGRRAPVIYVAAGLARVLVASGCAPRGARNGVLETVCHELAHYEQHRAGRAMTERGVQRRARSLMALAGFEHRDRTRGAIAPGRVHHHRVVDDRGL